MKNRRKWIKSIGLTPVWITPVIQSVILPAHAQTSATTTPSATTTNPPVTTSPPVTTTSTVDTIRTSPVRIRARGLSGPALNPGPFRSMETGQVAQFDPAQGRLNTAEVFIDYFCGNGEYTVMSTSNPVTVSSLWMSQLTQLSGPPGVPNTVVCDRRDDNSGTIPQDGGSLGVDLPQSSGTLTFPISGADLSSYTGTGTVTFSADNINDRIPGEPAWFQGDVNAAFAAADFYYTVSIVYTYTTS